MTNKRKQNADRTFSMTMFFVILAMLSVLGIAFYSHVIHKEQRHYIDTVVVYDTIDINQARQMHMQLDNLSDSVHFYEDGM